MEPLDVFLSYSRNDLAAASALRAQLNEAGISVFFDQESIRAGDLWLSELQEAVAACGTFVVLVGRDGVRRWIGAETQVALSRYSRTTTPSACRSSRSSWVTADRTPCRRSSSCSRPRPGTVSRR